MIKRTVSKSKFKPHALEYFRDVESSGEPLVVTDHGRPVLTIVPYEKDTKEKMGKLRNTVKKYNQPYEPLAVNDWEVLK